MINKQSINNIKGLFRTHTEDMPKISSPREWLSYTSLHLFQTFLNKNIRSVPSYQSHALGHLGLTVAKEDYKALNGANPWVDPPQATNEPRKPATAADENTEPFKAVEAIRSWTEKKNKHAVFIMTQQAFRKKIIKNVDDQYINKLHHEITK